MYGIHLEKMKNENTVRKYNEIWKQICEKLNWKYFDYSIKNDDVK